MKVYVADAETDRPDGSVVEKPWVELGTAQGSTLPSDEGVIRIQMQDAGTMERNPGSVYIPDLGIHETDVAVQVDDSGVLSIVAQHRP